VPDIQGRFVMEGLTPGTYGLVAGDLRNQKLLIPQKIQISAKSTTNLTLTTRTRELRLRILNPDGTPVKEMRCFISFGATARPESNVATDQNGWLTLDHAALAPIRVRLALVDRQVEVSSEDRTSNEIALTLPER
jgi:hypothetical protein